MFFYKRFELKEKYYLWSGIIRIIVDTETGVNYLMTSGIGLSGITPLLDKNGNIVIDKIKKDSKFQSAYFIDEDDLLTKIPHKSCFGVRYQ